MPRRQRLLAAVTAILVSAAMPTVLVSRASVLRTPPEAKGVYIQIPIVDPSAAPAVRSDVSRHTYAMPVPSASSNRIVAPSFAGDKGIQSVDADAFTDPFGGAIPASANNGPCAKASTCPDFQVRSARWPSDQNGTSVINWKFNDEGRRAVRAQPGLLEGAVSAAMAQWSHWDSNIVFRYQGLTTATFGATGKDGSCADGTNVVTWDKFDSDIIAMAGICTDKTGKIVRDADLALNVTYHWENINGTPSTRHSIDIRSIVTHELGHWLGLLDLYSPQDVHQTMSGYAGYGETNKRTPALGDIMGIQKLFPCAAGDSCPRSPIADD
jgi:hypothetical protein